MRAFGALRRPYGRCVLALASVALGFGQTASATTLSFTHSGIQVPDDPGITLAATAVFGFDPSCTTGCTLRIDLRYADVNGTGGLHSSAQALAGVVWDADGTLHVSRAGSAVIAPALVGVDAATARADLPDLTRDGVSGDAVTGQWAFRDDFDSALSQSVSTTFDPLGNFVLSSVGSLTAFGTTTPAVGRQDLLPGTISSVETNPPDGVPFAIVDPDTTDLVGNKDRVLAQGSTTAFLVYDGSLDGIRNVSLLFGTSGVAFGENGTLVPEPASAALVAGGLLALAARRRARPGSSRRRV